MECNSVYTDYLSNCQDDIVVNAGITPNTNFQWVIKDKFQNEYSGSLTTDADGNFTIPVDSLPDGLLNSYGGEFFLYVKQLYTCADVPLQMKGSYDGVLFQVRGGTREKNNLGCL